MSCSQEVLPHLLHHRVTGMLSPSPYLLSSFWKPLDKYNKKSHFLLVLLHHFITCFLFFFIRFVSESVMLLIFLNQGFHYFETSLSL